MRKILWCLLATIASCSHIVDGEVVLLPGDGDGVGFDDLRYSKSLNRVLAPGGRTGRVFLIHPDTHEVTSIPGFGTASYDGGHDAGPTSIDEGENWLYVTDRTTLMLSVVDPSKGGIVSSVRLGARPDYVRYVAKTNEVWVTEPSASRIEVFALGKESPLTATHSAFVPIDDGPESIVVDSVRGRVYVHRWHRETVAIDATTKNVVGVYPNGCAASRGIALDEKRGFLFAACLEGTVSTLDIAHDGRILSSIARGAGFDVIGYNDRRSHLYLAGSACQCLVMLAVDSAGRLSFLERYVGPSDTHCVTADDRGSAWVCSPDAGLLRVVNDPFPASGG